MTLSCMPTGVAVFTPMMPVASSTGLIRYPGFPGAKDGSLGARLTLGDFNFTSSYWWLDQDSELIFVGDSNSVEPKGGSERDGYELTMFWQPLKLAWCRCGLYPQ